MTGYLGYDPVRVARLAGVVADLDLELRSLREADPLAAGPLDACRLAHRLVADHLPRLHALVSCHALTRPVALDPGDPTWLIAGRAGAFAVVHDPLGLDRDATADDAAAALTRLGLHGTLLPRTGDAERWRAVAQVLALAASDTGSARLVAAALGPQGVTRLADALGRAAESTVADDTPFGAPDVLAALGRLAALVAAASPLPGPFVRAIARQAHPVAAAALLGQAGAHGAALAAGALAILERLVTSGQPTLVRRATDQVLAALAADPAAARHALTHASDRVLDLVLASPYRDPEVAGRVLVRATHPGTTTSAQASRIVPRVLDCLERHHHRFPPPGVDLPPSDDPWSFRIQRPPHLGAIVGWWLEGLIDEREDGGPPGRDGSPVTPWAVEPRSSARQLAWVTSDRVDAALVRTAALRLVGARAAALDDPDHLEHLGYVAGAALDVVRDHALDDAEASTAAWSRFTTGVSLLLGTTSLGSAAVTVSSRFLVATGASPLDQVLRAMVGGGPAELRTVGALVVGRHDHDLAMVEQQVAAAVARTLPGVSPPPAPPAPDRPDPGDKGDEVSSAYHLALDAWSATLPGHVAKDLAARRRAVAAGFERGSRYRA